MKSKSSYKSTSKKVPAAQKFTPACAGKPIMPKGPAGVRTTKSKYK